MNEVKGSLTRKLGPLPVWAWALVTGGVLYWYRNRGGGLLGGSAATGTPAGSLAGAPSAAGSDTGAVVPTPKAKKPKKHKKPRKVKVKAKHPKPHPHPKPKPRRRHVIPGRKPHPHNRAKAHPPRRHVKPRGYGLKAALARRVTAAPSPLVQASAHGTQRHAGPAVRARFHTATLGNGSRPAEHYHGDLSRTGELGPHAHSRPPRGAAPAEQAPARRSHSNAPAHAVVHSSTRLRHSEPSAAPAVKAPPKPARKGRQR